MLGQDRKKELCPLLWAYSSKGNDSFVRWSKVAVFVMESLRKSSRKTFGKEPDVIWLPWTKKQVTELMENEVELQLSLSTYHGKVETGKVELWKRYMDALQPSLQLRVLDNPQPGLTYFTDASSVTDTAVVVWKEANKWEKLIWVEAGKSVQWLEAKAMCLALEQTPEKHINVCTDSMYVYKLVQSMKRGGYANGDISNALQEALGKRTGTVTVIHINSHQNCPGPLVEGNTKADSAAKRLWTLQQASELHRKLHIGAKALAKECNIPIREAREVVATCPYCQHSPLWEAGVNPRGLQARELWQTDFTECSLMAPRKHLAVTVDTYSGAIMATPHIKQTGKTVIQHWVTVMAWLGTPKTIKTDNGPCFRSTLVEDWCKKWDIELKHGIPYNCQGQGIVERGHRALKEKIKILGEEEGYSGKIPTDQQNNILNRALLALNHYIRGHEQYSPIEKQYLKQQVATFPQVRVKFPGELQWESGWRLRTIGRGYAAVEKEGLLRWVPSRCIKAELKEDQNKANENCEFLSAGLDCRTPSQPVRLSDE
uniref:RNA-directed DNA polymerase n=1 Tax=Strigops habroptila TaxID=2489341 RepID=A0A672U120_STRHB